MAAGALFSRACGRGVLTVQQETLASSPSPAASAAVAAAAMRLRPAAVSVSLCLPRPRQQLPCVPECQVRWNRYLKIRRNTPAHYGPPPWIQPRLPWKTKQNKLPPKPPSPISLEPVDLHVKVKRSRHVDVAAIDREITRNNEELFVRAGKYSRGIGVMEAVRLLKAYDLHPDPVLRLSVQLNVEPGVQHLRASLKFPRPVSFELRIVVFAEGDEALDAKKAGATFVGGESMIQQVVRGELDFDRVLCSPELFRKVSASLGRILGPRGLMPTVRRGTVTSDMPKAIQELQGVTEFVGNAQNVMCLDIAKHHFTDMEILANIRAVMRSIETLGTPNYAIISTSSGMELLLEMEDLLRNTEEVDDQTYAIAA